MRRRPASLCKGARTGMATMVVQLGLPTMPLGMLRSASPLASGTTSGTSGSMRQAEELSITMAPLPATRIACSRDAGAPMANKATSRPPTSAVATSSTTTSDPAQGRRLPAEREEAKV